MNSFDSTISYFGCVSCFWKDLQDLTLLGGIFSTSWILLSLGDLSGSGAEGTSDMN
jgi:hypothetical protein